MPPTSRLLARRNSCCFSGALNLFKSPKSVQHQFCPKNFSTLSREINMRILKIIAANKFSQPVIQGNVCRLVCGYFSAFEYTFCLARVINGLGLITVSLNSHSEVWGGFCRPMFKRVFFFCVCFSFRADFASQIQEESKRLNETRWEIVMLRYSQGYLRINAKENEVRRVQDC